MSYFGGHFFAAGYFSVLQPIYLGLFDPNETLTQWLLPPYNPTFRSGRSGDLLHPQNRFWAKSGLFG